MKNAVRDERTAYSLAEDPPSLVEICGQRVTVAFLLEGLGMLLDDHLSESGAQLDHQHDISPDQWTPSISVSRSFGSLGTNGCSRMSVAQVSDIERSNEGSTWQTS